MSCAPSSRGLRDLACGACLERRRGRVVVAGRRRDAAAVFAGVESLCVGPTSGDRRRGRRGLASAGAGVRARDVRRVCAGERPRRHDPHRGRVLRHAVPSRRDRRRQGRRGRRGRARGDDGVERRAGAAGSHRASRDPHRRAGGGIRGSAGPAPRAGCPALADAGRNASRGSRPGAGGPAGCSATSGELRRVAADTRCVGTVLGRAGRACPSAGTRARRIRFFARALGSGAAGRAIGVNGAGRRSAGRLRDSVQPWLAVGCRPPCGRARHRRLAGRTGCRAPPGQGCTPGRCRAHPRPRRAERRDEGGAGRAPLGRASCRLPWAGAPRHRPRGGSIRRRHDGTPPRPEHRRHTGGRVRRTGGRCHTPDASRRCSGDTPCTDRRHAGARAATGDVGRPPAPRRSGLRDRRDRARRRGGDEEGRP